MQMYPKEGGYKEHHFAAVEEEFVVKDEYCNYNNGPSMPMMKPGYFNQGQGYGGQNGQFRHNYDQNSGYGGHNGQFKPNGFGGFNNHHRNGGEVYSEEFSESSWYEEESRANMRNDFPGQGGNHHYLQNGGGMKQNGYGAHGGHFGPPPKRATVWDFKGITD